MSRAFILVVLCLAAGCAAPPPPAPAPACPETAEAWLARGRLLELEGRIAEAERAYRRAHALGDPWGLWRLAHLIWWHHRSARLEEAARLFERCLVELEDEELVLWRSGRPVTVRTALRLQLAQVYLEMRRLDDAQRLLDAVLEEEPDRWLAIELRGDIDLAQGRLDAARARYRAALERVDPAREGAEGEEAAYKLRWADRIDDPFW